MQPAPPTINGFQTVVADAQPFEPSVHERSYAQEVHSLQALAVPPPPAIEHAWYVRFTVTQQGIIGAASFEDVSRKIKEQFGEGVEIIMVQRA